MTYYVNPIWFYLSDICHSTKGVMLGMAITLLCFGFIGYLITSGITADIFMGIIKDLKKDRKENEEIWGRK